MIRITAYQLDAQVDALITALTLSIRLILKQDTSVTKTQGCVTSTRRVRENVRILMEHLGIPLKGLVINAKKCAIKLG